MNFDFVKNQAVESLDKVPADFQVLYTESEDGKFKLNTEDATVGSAVKAISGLAKALNASRAETKAAKERVVDLGPLSEYGDSVDTIVTKFNTTLAEARTKAGNTGKEEIDKAVNAAKTAMQTQFAKDLETHTTLNKTLKGQLYKVMVTGEAKAALADAGAVDPELVIPYLSQKVKVEEENGQFGVRVVDENGDVRFGGTGSQMTVKELVGEMKADPKYGPLFKSETPSGGGARPTDQRRVVPGGKKREDMTPNEKISLGLKKGQFTRGAVSEK